MKRYNNDLFRRTEAARMASRRAANRLARKVNDVGGLDSEMRYHMSQMKREQAKLKREMQGLKLEYQKKSTQANKRQGVIHYAEPNLKHSSDDDEDHLEIFHKETQATSAPISHKDYGRNYFGYHSTPGSRKKHEKSVKELELSIETSYSHAMDVEDERKRKKKLKLQKKHNLSVQEKVDSWKDKNSDNRRKFSVTLPPNVEHLMFLREELLATDVKTEQDDKEVEILRLPEVAGQKAQAAVLGDPDALSDLSNIDIASNARNALVKVERTSERNETRTTRTSSANRKFDGEIYAPDGRVRMVHRLPDPSKAFEEARSARYVRTKYKRDFERQLSVSDIFK